METNIYAQLDMCFNLDNFEGFLKLFAQASWEEKYYYLRQKIRAKRQDIVNFIMRL